MNSSEKTSEIASQTGVRREHYEDAALVADSLRAGIQNCERRGVPVDVEFRRALTQLVVLEINLATAILDD